MTQPNNKHRQDNPHVTEAGDVSPTPTHPTVDQTLVPATRHGDEVPTIPIDVGQSEFRSRFPEVPGYEILSELGRGGMGIVYQARHLQLNRVVALKMIRSGAQAGSEDVRRFREEAAAVARMQHPNIVQIYEVGEIEGLPFFSLEFVDGGSLQQRMSKDTPIPARAAAALIETLARAMDYSHQNGIVHRDLKPANVLLSGEWRVASGEQVDPSLLATRHSPLATPKITDFGLAKQLEKDSGQTREGSVLGTPSYMAPEQALGRHKEVGPSADIYALGAILYDLLARRPPFCGETVMDTLQQVINNEPMPPRRLQPQLSRDLEIVCLKCLEKDARKRYHTAGELADDLRRFLNDEPIQARATPLWEKGFKWTKRRPAAATLLVFALITIGALIGGSMWFAAEKSEQARLEADLRNEAEKARELAKQKADNETKLRLLADDAAREADKQRQLARRRAGNAEAVVDRLLTQVGERDLDNIPQLQPFLRVIRTQVLHYLKQFHEDNRNDPLLIEQLAFVQRHIGRILEETGDHKGAIRAYQEALRLSGELVKATPEALQHVRNSGIIADKLALILQATAKDETELKKADEVFALAVTNLNVAYNKCLKTPEKGALLAGRIISPMQPAELRWGAVSDMVLAETWTRFSDQTAFSLADARIHRGNLRLQTGRLPEARADFNEAIKLFTALHQDDPANPNYRWRLGAALGNLAVNLYTSNPANIGEAVEMLDRSLVYLDPLVKEHGYSARYRADRAGVYRNRGLFRFISAKQGAAGNAALKQAEADVKVAAQAFDQMATQFSGTPAYLEQLADCHEKLALIQQAANRSADSLKSWNEAIKALNDLRKLRNSSADRRKLAHYLDSRAGVRVRLPMPQPEEATSDWQASISLLEGLLKEEPRSPELWGLLLNLHLNRVATWKIVGRVVEAERDMDPFVEALEERRNRLGNHPEHTLHLAAAYHDWGQLLRERGRAEDAESKIRRGVYFQQEVLKVKADDPDVRRLLCLSLLSLGDVKEVAEEVRNWIASIPGAKGRHQEAAWILSQCAVRSKIPAEAEMYARSAVELLQKAHEAGFKEAKFLQKKQFDILRSRADFKELAAIWK